jgi:signal transduction histidine kinase
LPPIVAASRPDARPHDHLVSFYETAEYLARSVAQFLAPALQQGGTAIVLGTHDHRDRFRTALAAEGIDLTAVGDRYVQLDADTTLSAIMRDGSIEPGLFREVIGNLVANHTRPGRPVHAFGEMVALLWERGGLVDALRCEELWNELLATTPVSLLCSYPTSAFEDDRSTEDFTSVCGLHSAVLPTESFSLLADDAVMRRTAFLEQQAVADSNERDALRTEREVLRDKQDELEAAIERLQIVDRERQQFTAMVVHDLQNPTVVLSTVLELLSDHRDELDAEQIDRYLDFAARSTTQIQRLIDDILLMGRLESGTFTFELEALDLGSLVEEVAAAVRERTGRRIEVRIEDGLPKAQADLGRQQQILGNLISNATKFSDAPHPVAIEIVAGDAELIVHIRDQGNGIEAADLPKLFQPFSRIGEMPGRREGTGLGLFIARALVEGQGGTIEAESTRGVGTTFTYTVPVAPDAPAFPAREGESL